MDKQTASSGGIGFFGLLGIVFIVLKLTGVIDWSWWLVLLPIYGALALLLAIVLGIGLFWVFVQAISWVIEKNDARKMSANSRRINRGK
jgi:hypothetical protein